MHGGAILKLLDQVAYACASRYAGRYVVTLSVDQVTFREPIHVGELVTFLASVNYTGNTSLEIGIKVIAEDIRTHVARHANRCYFTMVAVDEAGKPTAVPPFKPSTSNEHRRFEEAKLQGPATRARRQTSGFETPVCRSYSPGRWFLRGLRGHRV
jgi:acyl-CoA hydrolase